MQRVCFQLKVRPDQTALILPEIFNLEDQLARDAA